MKTDTINPTSTNLRQDVDRFAHKTESLIDTGAEAAKEKVAAAREHVDHAVERGQELYGMVHDKAVAGIHAADEVVHDKPYHAIGIALTVGTILGYMLAGRCSCQRS